jgi:hypothetical protein
MTFVAPFFLLAALAGAVPVLLHLIHTRRSVPVRFSTLQFLLLSVKRTNRRRKIENLALLLARIAILVLIALALAGPAVNSLESFLGGGEPVAVVVILDNSASMATVDRGQPRFDTARRSAEQILDLLRDGDAVALLPTGGPPFPEYGKLFHRHETVRQALAQCQVSNERADLAAKMQQARRLLAKAEAHKREIYVITDNQSLSWQGLKDPDDLLRGGGEEAAVIVVNLNREPAANVAVQRVRLEAPALAVGVPIEARVEVRNTSAVAQQKHLELHLNGSKEAVSPTLTLPPGATVTHHFHFTLDRAGVHRGEVRLAEEDGNPLDNQRYFGLVVDKQVRVAIVKPRKHDIPYLEDTFYLEQALAPRGGDGWAIRARVFTPGQLASEKLAGYAVVFCVNLPAPDEALAERLRDYAWSGGHLFWVCGDNVQPDAYNRIDGKMSGQLLPASLAQRRQRSRDQGDSWHIGTLEKSHPALAPLTEPASLYRSVLVHRHHSLMWDKQAEVRVLARLDDGQPLLVERTVGSGSTLLLGTGVHVEWTNLPLKQLFLPLFARLTFHLAGAATDRSQLLAGSPLVVPIRGRGKPVDVEVLRPSGAVVRTRSEAKADTFQYTDTHEVGIYQLRLNESGGMRTRVFAVNTDPDESEAAYLTSEELKRRFGEHPLLICDDPEDLAGTLNRLREGTSLWTPLLLAVLVVLMLEALLANTIGRQKEDKVRR